MSNRAATAARIAKPLTNGLMMDHFADRLIAAIKAREAPACVGFDPLPDRLPIDLRPAAGAGDEAFAAAITRFGRGVIEAVAPFIPAIKINIAFFEPYQEHGWRAYTTLVREARAAGLIVIGDVKRGDIGHTSGQYARAHLSDSSGDPTTNCAPDAITINPYFGSDGVAPFVEAARDNGRGVFILVQTSNESAAEVQGLQLPGGDTVCQHVARLVQQWAGGSELVGTSGYSCIGAVVSPRDLESTIRIREMMPNCVFLVPGFGAQGRTADEVAKCFKEDGTGALVTASRSVIYAFNEVRHRDSGQPWTEAVALAAREFVDALRSVLQSPK